MRGDRPIVVAQRDVTLLFTPHARGSTLTPPFCLVIDLVYPACAGIDRLYPLLDIPRRSLPRMRGDRPTCRQRIFPFWGLPHARIDLLTAGIFKLSSVYPHARIDLRSSASRPEVYPHAGIDQLRITTGQSGFTTCGSTLNKCSAMSRYKFTRMPDRPKMRVMRPPSACLPRMGIDRNPLLSCAQGKVFTCGIDPCPQAL